MLQQILRLLYGVLVHLGEIDEWSLRIAVIRKSCDLGPFEALSAAAASPLATPIFLNQSSLETRFRSCL